jgi:hypothetical protein
MKKPCRTQFRKTLIYFSTASLAGKVDQMKLGTYTFQPEKAEGFDFHVFRVKTEMGVRLTPQKDMYSNIAVFADNVAVRNHPDWMSQSPLGPAKMGNNNFNIYWNIVCATQPEHRAEQLSYMGEIEAQSEGVWLNSQYFADQGHCTCPRCQQLWKKSGLGWVEWRRREVTEYMAQVRERVKKELVLCIQPDPVSSLERYGVDFDDFAKFADKFCVVMFSKNYATPWYWEMLTRGFKKLLKKPFYVAFYMYGPGDNPKDVPTTQELLTVSVRCARVGAEGFLYLTEGASQIRNFQKEAIAQTALIQKLRTYGGQPVQEFLDRIEGWKNSFSAY